MFLCLCVFRNAPLLSILFLPTRLLEPQLPFGASYSMRYVGIRSAQSVAICDKGYFLLLREKDIDTRVHGIVSRKGMFDLPHHNIISDDPGRE